MRRANSLALRGLAWLRNWLWVMMWAVVIWSILAGFGIDWSPWDTTVLSLLGLIVFPLTAIEAVGRRRVLGLFPISRWILGRNMWVPIEVRPLPANRLSHDMPWWMRPYQPRRVVARGRPWSLGVKKDDTPDGVQLYGAGIMGRLIYDQIRADDSLARVESDAGMKSGDVVEWEPGLHVIGFGSDVWVLEAVLQPLDDSRARPADIVSPDGETIIVSMLPDGTAYRKSGSSLSVLATDRAHRVTATLREAMPQRNVVAVGIAVGRTSTTAPTRLAPGGVFLPQGIPVWTESEAIAELSDHRRQDGVVTVMDRKLVESLR